MQLRRLCMQRRPRMLAGVHPGSRGRRALGVELVEGLDGDELLLALEVHHGVHRAPHHQLPLLTQARLAVPAQVTAAM